MIFEWLYFSVLTFLILVHSSATMPYHIINLRCLFVWKILTKCLRIKILIWLISMKVKDKKIVSVFRLCVCLFVCLFVCLSFTNVIFLNYGQTKGLVMWFLVCILIWYPESILCLQKIFSWPSGSAHLLAPGGSTILALLR